MTRSTPHSPQPGETPLAGVVHRNIQALAEVRRREDQRRTPSDRIADAVTHFAGSMWSVAVHALLFGGWILVNLGLVPAVKPFDPFPFVMLAMFASVEAIFLSTFILVSQNRMQRLADRRAELDVQISLLTEHELTRAIHLLDEVARAMNVRRPPDPELREIKQDVAPEKVVEEIAKVEEQHDKQKGL
jgi:uncharacterized membrane protein